MRTPEEIETSHMTTANVKHSLTPTQIKHGPLTKSLFAAVTITHISFPPFNKESTRHANRQGKHGLRKQSKHQNQTRRGKDFGIIRTGI